MKKLTFLLFCLLFCSGCATYRYGKGAKPPYDKGYVVTRQNYTIPEYTLGKNNTVPADLKVAKERFKRRRDTVEKYYKKMGLIENRFKQYIVDNMANMLKLIGGVFTLPYRAYEDYKYEHNKEYHQKVVRESEQEDATEKAKYKVLHQELNAYVQDDLAKEPPVLEVAPSEPEKKQEVVSSQQPEPAKEIPAEPVQEAPKEEVKVEVPVEAPVEKEPEKILEPALVQEAAPTQPVPVQEAVPTQPAPQQKKSFMESILKQLSNKDKPKPKPKVKPSAVSQPKAVIIAKPQKGISPLKVQFYGSDSYSKGAKIISYEWDFGDGDKSIDRNPVNTFWCKSFGTTQFKVTLTVEDTNGNTDTASVFVEVKTKPEK